MPPVNSTPTTRALALVALRKIWEQGRKPKGAIEELSGSLDNRERSFLMELVYGVLRYRDTLDWALHTFVRKPSGLHQDTRNNLRLAAYQILFMRVQDWAAVNEAVQLEKHSGRPEVVNGVLRSMLRKPMSERLNLTPLERKGAVPYIALLTSHPSWLIKRWVKRFGEKGARELAEANNRIPPLTLRVNTLCSTREQLLEWLSSMGIKGKPSPFSPDGIRLKGSSMVKELSGMKASFLVQDEAAQLITYLLEPKPGERILDACASPGGKTTHIAQMMKDRGEVLAMEIDAERMPQLQENVSNLNTTSIALRNQDFRELNKSREGSFDKILLDAPCSALGVIRRNPDIKYRRTLEDLKEFMKKQLAMLRDAAQMLKPGGSIVYSVCSTEPEEGEEVVKEFLKDSEDFYIIDTALPFLKGFMKEGLFRTYPHIHDMDGFFGVKLCKRV
ncbi:MAG TPA: 16S rRNA (cytosine(967)-C(5))-methyltransferase RsmB [Thermodesulfovibrionales bacterium]|nr:16S rRNA (cytosine(967)-C(5))-methyltransferase RsmB [Thermodesulfovibrionales bacterium]